MRETRSGRSMASVRRVCVGQVTDAHGLRGEFCVRSFTADPAAVAGYGPVSDEAGLRALTLRIVGRKKDLLIATADGVVDRTAAEALKGARLFVARDALPATDEDEFYHADLIGLAVVATDDAGSVSALGRVVAVHDFGAGPVLEVEGPAQGPVLVPFTRAAVPEVDLDGGRVVVAPLPGLLRPHDERAASDEDAAADARRDVG